MHICYTQAPTQTNVRRWRSSVVLLGLHRSRWMAKRRKCAHCMRLWSSPHVSRGAWEQQHVHAVALVGTTAIPACPCELPPHAQSLCRLRGRQVSKLARSSGPWAPTADKQTPSFRQVPFSMPGLLFTEVLLYEKQTLQKDYHKKKRHPLSTLFKHKTRREACACTIRTQQGNLYTSPMPMTTMCKGIKCNCICKQSQTRQTMHFTESLSPFSGDSNYRK